MLPKYDKLYAALAVVVVALLTILTPAPDLFRLAVMSTVCGAAFVAERIL